MDFEMVNNMKVKVLKNYLRLRGLKVSGRKPELVARVFAAMENNVKPIKSAEEVEQEIRSDYQKKLILKDYVIPDPNFLNDGWMSEVDGILFWPMILYPDIFTYLTFYPSELKSDDLNDYKNSKAYSYFSDGWLSPLSYHEVHLHQNIV